MYATIQKWGNSHGVRIPKSLMDALGMRENDQVELIQTDDAITIRKAAARHKTLEERLVTFYGKPIEQIDRVAEAEVDWGKPEGREIW